MMERYYELTMYGTTLIPFTPEGTDVMNALMTAPHVAIAYCSGGKSVKHLTDDNISIQVVKADVESFPISRTAAEAIVAGYNKEDEIIALHVEEQRAHDAANSTEVDAE